ncbi:hypothetical protein BAE44_0014209 [Dichanthelium oligosanthes]|uniref:Uncharacterized protein n=1 Tax=Dichanthelium oligosanthes TaxID=888268 RepID=A0A1E5VI31_9POAL|nr:hypothetical protein BAE44_0014209 [Dichanthelium oligosanthes]
MCAVAPFVLPGVACVAPRAEPVLGVRPTTMATTYAEGAPAMWHGYGYENDDGDIAALLRGIDAVVRPPKPADLPMPPMELLALSRPRHGDHHDADFIAMLRGIPSIRVPAARLASVPMDAHDATPTTPVAVLAAPRSYGDDAAEGDAVTITEKQPQ